MSSPGTVTAAHAGPVIPSIGRETTPTTSSPRCASLPSVDAIEKVAQFRELSSIYEYAADENACLARNEDGSHSVTFSDVRGEILPTVLTNGGMRSTLVRVSVVLSGELFVYRNGRTCSVRRQLALLKVWGKA